MLFVPSVTRQATPAQIVAAAIAKRFAVLCGLLLTMSFGIFALQFAAPGGVVGALTGGRPTSAETIRDLTAKYHLDDSIVTQYFAWLKRALHGDLGTSYVQNVDVRDLVVDRGLISLELAVFAFAIAMLVAFPLAVCAALNKGRLLDRLASSTAIFAIAAPSFVVGLVLLYVFGLKWGLLPVYGAGTGLGGRLQHLILPALALAIGQIGLVVKVARTALIDAYSQDHVTFAQSRGLGRLKILTAYALRNSMSAITTAAGLTFTTLIVGTVLVERIFAVPGAGSLLLDSVKAGDLPVVQGLSVAVAATILLLNFFTDVLSAMLDPRVDLGKVI